MKYDNITFNIVNMLALPFSGTPGSRGWSVLKDFAADCCCRRQKKCVGVPGGTEGQSSIYRNTAHIFKLGVTKRNMAGGTLEQTSIKSSQKLQEFTPGFRSMPPFNIDVQPQRPDDIVPPWSLYFSLFKFCFANRPFRFASGYSNPPQSGSGLLVFLSSIIPGG